LAPEVAHFQVNGLGEEASSAPQTRQLREIARVRYPILAAAGNIEDLLNMLLGEAIKRLEHRPERAAAPFLFGLKDTSSYGLTLEVRQEKAAAVYKKHSGKSVSPATFRQNMVYEKTIIINVGRKIEELAEEGPVEELAPVQADVEVYVRRRELEEKLREALRQAKLVVLAGEGGVGKTTLAKEFINRQKPYDCMFIEADPTWLLLNIKRELARFQVDTTNLSDSETLLQFSELLARESGSRPKYVVIDNLTNWKLLDHILPLHLTTRIIVTARHELSRRKYICVETGNLSEAEATELVRRRLPGISDEDVEYFKCLKGRAIALDLICAAVEGKSPEDRIIFLATLKRKIVRVLDATSATLNRPALTTVYREIIAELRSCKESGHALRLLMVPIAVWVGEPHRKFLRACMATGFDGSVDQHLGDLLYDSAKEVLRRYHLAREDNERLYIHELTSQILEDIFSDSLREVRLWLLSAFLPQLEKYQEVWGSESKSKSQPPTDTSGRPTPEFRIGTPGEIATLIRRLPSDAADGMIATLLWRAALITFPWAIEGKMPMEVFADLNSRTVSSNLSIEFHLKNGLIVKISE
jgi:hypothetical protein